MIALDFFQYTQVCFYSKPILFAIYVRKFYYEMATINFSIVRSDVRCNQCDTFIFDMLESDQKRADCFIVLDQRIARFRSPFSHNFDRLFLKTILQIQFY